ncbi:ClpXP protease specificity-enhancing factor [Chromatium okenii]|jgi:stringent starvation protein B|uniref:ClpXP protease specificity-enhancing factor n=2 Tax=Chromatium okenii TaxID=61644 RepID=A0A2S7XQQ2_9GAMM|nr:ClpXP protease specificity-enhancing factor [Chromatium okenii]
MNAQVEAAMTSSKPYLIRALYEWILDNQMTPHLAVDANYPATQVPLEFVTAGQIVLNITPSAVHGLVIGNDWIAFNARFGGIAREIMVPTEAVLGIFTRENNQGMMFPDPIYPDAPDTPPAGPTLKSVGSGGSPTPPDKPKGKGKAPSLKIIK